MTNEIELKLVVTPHFAENFSTLLSDFHILKQQELELANTYYDTVDGYFSREKMGLRVRSEQGEFTMTLKTDGKSSAGLHIRPEYNFSLNDDKPDLSLLAILDSFSIPANLEVKPIFTTDFQRQSWLIECGRYTEIEIALDRGEIVANGMKEDICEVEFELKQGELADLFNLVANLSLADGVRLSSASKAKRGYCLAKGSFPSLIDWIEQWRDFLKIEKSAVNSQQILTALFSLEQKLIEETVFFTPAFFAQDFMKTVERVGAFFNLYHYYVESRELFGKLAQENRQNESIVAMLMESHQHCYEQLKNIIGLHSETKDNTVAMNKLNEFLYQGQYVKRMINLMKLTVVG
ncbi:MAG: inorganic triphosphatase [Lonepinella koalarum]|nr:inorganic triphosphatase [Lonepinella koalarum]